MLEIGGSRLDVELQSVVHVASEHVARSPGKPEQAPG